MIHPLLRTLSTLKWDDEKKALLATFTIPNLTIEDVDYVMSTFKWDDGRTGGLAIILKSIDPSVNVANLWSACLRYMKWDDGRCKVIALLLSSSFVPTLEKGMSLITTCMKWDDAKVKAIKALNHALVSRHPLPPVPQRAPAPVEEFAKEEPPFPLNLPYDYLLRRYQQQRREVKESLLRNPDFTKNFTPHVLKELEMELEFVKK